jgi:type II secretory pathway pseudopilin PulG
MENKKADVWVSTVLYILIGLAVMGTLLAVIRPKIADLKDFATIEQSINSMNKFDEIMSRVRQSTGTSLKYNLQLSRGNFLINAVGENITWILKDSAHKYSEESVPLSIGNIDALTKKNGNVWQITLTRDYSNSNIDMTVNSMDRDWPLTPAKIPYTIFIENLGIENGKQHIDISIK